MHSSDNLDDGYVGSGKRLGYSINKHGLENHVCEKLDFFDTREELRERETKIVDKNLIEDSSCINIALGGGGGWIDEEHQLKCSSAGGKAISHKLKTDADFSKTWKTKVGANFKSRWENNEFDKSGKNNGFYGKHHTEESKQKQRKADRTAVKNSQYGTCWITNGKENKKIHRGDNIPECYRLGRKMK